MTPVISLLTDFGLRDPFVGIMKAVILSICPSARLVDLTHEVAPQNIRQGAFALASAVRYCPSGTVHVAVVDPGVGTERDAIVVQTHRARYVAPDNGLLTMALGLDPPIGAWRLTKPQFFLPEVSSTFHGRDIFAPVAAHLATGQSAADMGEPLDLDALQKLMLKPPAQTDDRVHATVLYVDRFGNLVTNVHRDDFDPREVLKACRGDVEAPVAATYGAVQPGEFVAVWGSSGYLELSRSMGSAASSLQAAEGTEIDVVMQRTAP